MENDLENHLCEELLSILHGYGIDASPQQVKLLVGHLLCVIERNRVVNLTRIVNAEDALVLHILDSLLPLCCNVFEEAPLTSFVDIGTGAGYPGIPIGIMTGYQGLLIDSVGKKVDAVHDFVVSLGLSDQLQTKKMRAEELDASMLGSYGCVVVRAVAKTNILIEYAQPFLTAGGYALIAKGNPDDIEIAHASRAATICGMSFVSRETFELPRNLGHREILVYMKTGSPRIHLPRPVGIAKTQPLGV